MTKPKSLFDSRFTFRLKKENHIAMRKIAFLTGKTQSELLDEVLGEVLERHKKLLTYADVTT